MVDLNQFFSLGGLAILTMIGVQIVKGFMKPGDEDKRWIPLWAIGIGVVFSYILAWGIGALGDPAQIVAALLGGILSGASSVGLYEATLNQFPPRTPSSQ